VFSLTGGLDTRAILAALSRSHTTLVACTLSGGLGLSLDARLARTVSSAYGMKHIIVTLGSDFLRELPDHVTAASRLSGGLSSLSQAHEVYFYRQLQGLGSRRLSGYLGNQIGHQGVEALSLRGADLTVLHPRLTRASVDGPAKHWLTFAGRSTGALNHWLVLREAPFSSVANFSIGHHFMIQQSPYASRRLIEITLALQPGAGSHMFLKTQARLRDIRHRFLGEPKAESFQRRMIEATGGPVADCFINWGWLAKGGVSLKGIGWGALAFADAVSSRSQLLSTLARHGLAAFNATGMHEITQCREWFNTILLDFVNDILRSKLIAEGGLFNNSALRRQLDEHYRGGQHRYTTLLASLDIALAQESFSAR
jgi:hypothetical protein